MAEAKKTVDAVTVNKAPDPFERVTVKLPKDSGKDEYAYVSVNDYSATIKRGATVEVPRYVADELKRSEAAQDAFDATSERLLSMNDK